MRGCGWRGCPLIGLSLSHLPPNPACTRVVRSKRTLRARARMRQPSCKAPTPKSSTKACVREWFVPHHLPPQTPHRSLPHPCLGSAPTPVPHHRLRSREQSITATPLPIVVPPAHQPTRRLGYAVCFEALRASRSCSGATRSRSRPGPTPQVEPFRLPTSIPLDPPSLGGFRPLSFCFSRNKTQSCI